MRKLIIASALCLATATTSAGCFGQFALTRKLYGFNKDISEDKVIRSIATWVMIIIPVYAVGGLVDFIVLNPIEFFDGSNPVKAEASADQPTRLVRAQTNDGATVAIGHALFRLTPNGPSGFLLERDGIRLGTAEIADDGSIIAYDANGDELRTLSAAEVDARMAEIQLQAGS